MDLFLKEGLDCDLTAFECLSPKTHSQLLVSTRDGGRAKQVILDLLDTLVHGSESEGKNVIVTFLLQGSCLSATVLCSKLFELVANSIYVHIHTDVIALISLINTQMVQNNCAVKYVSGAHA